MRIGVLSDSHIPSSTRRLPEQLFRAFEGVDLILHAGDIYVASALDHLESLAPVLAVGESTDLAIGQPRVERKRVVEAEGARIGMIHILGIPKVPGEIFPGFIEKAGCVEAVPGAMRAIFGQDVDACVFGDTHYEVLERHGPVLLLNPGSPTLPHQMMRLGTVGILTVQDGRVDAELLNLNDFPGPAPVYI
jgi:putative phosphoesterase